MVRWGIATTESALVGVVIALVSLQPRAAKVAVHTRSADEQLMTAAATGDRQGFESALERGADPSAHDGTGATALTSAAASGRAEMAQRLVDLGANVDAIDGRGATPLMYAASSNHLAVVRLLLEHGANPAITCNGRTAADWAKLAKSQQCLDLLLQWEANGKVDVRN